MKLASACVALIIIMRLQQIKHWFGKIGVVQTKCELREISDGHSGLFATADIEPDEVCSTH